MATDADGTAFAFAAHSLTQTVDRRRRVASLALLIFGWLWAAAGGMRLHYKEPL